MRISNELTAHLQRLLKSFHDQIAEDSVLDRSNFDRIDMLIGAFPDDLLHSSFRAIASNGSQKRDSLDGQGTISLLKSLQALLETEILVDGINLRQGGDPELIPFFSAEAPDRLTMIDKCSELRDIITKSLVLTPPFRNRLLKRVAAIEIEINKEEGTFDTILAGMVEAGEALGKFGEAVKPITDRFTELMSFGRRSAKEFDALPPPDEIKRLPPPEAPEAPEE